MTPRPFSRGFTPVELMLVVATIGILSPISFLRFQAKSKQTGAKANLRSLFATQRAQYQEKDKYLTLVGELGFNPERGNRCYYQLGAGTNQQRNAVTTSFVVGTDTGITVDTFKYVTMNPTPVAAAFNPTTTAANEGMPMGAVSGVYGNCPRCNFLAYAAGDMDYETTGIDTWYVASMDFNATPVCGESTVAPAGTVWNDYDDVSCL